LNRTKRCEKNIEEIRERLNPDNHNSSKPPSSDGYNKPSPKPLRKKSGKKPGDSGDIPDTG
jgi:hypothetical protein